MSKMRFIRCKTPDDVLVVKNRADFNALCDSLPMAGGCGHNHQIVCGDFWFSRGRKLTRIKE